MLEIKAPDKLKRLKGSKTVFMAGSIDLGKAVNWQKKLKEAFEGDKRVTFWNPRRDNWNNSWRQEIDFKPFNEQVTWELNAQEKCDIVIFYFDPKGQAPITLLELGLFAKTKPSIVCCPKGFWRKGNVDIVCERYGINQVDSLEDLIEKLNEMLD